MNVGRAADLIHAHEGDLALVVSIDGAGAGATFVLEFPSERAAEAAE